MEPFRSRASLADDAFNFMAEFQRYLESQPENMHMKEQGAQWILEQVAASYGVPALSLWLSAPWGRWTLAASTGLDPQAHQRLFAARGSFRHLDTVRESGEPLIVEDLCAHPSLAFRAWSRVSGIRTTASLPLFGPGVAVMGVLTVMWRDPPVQDRAFGPRWENVARTLSLGWQWMNLWESKTQSEVVSRAVTGMTGAAAVHVFEGRVEYFNQQFAELFGMARVLLHQELAVAVKAMRKMFQDPEKFEQIVSRIAANREEWVDQVLELKGIPTRYLRWASRPAYANGHYQGRVAVFTDVTVQVMAERHHESFLSLASHEFRTPVTIIQGVSELLQVLPGADVPEVSEAALIIWRESMRLGRTIREIWGAAEAARDPSLEDGEALDFAAMARSEVDIAQRMWPERIWRYRGPETLRAHLNYEMLLTVMQALLGNAGRFSPGTEAVEVEVEAVKDMVALRVMDRGPGIDHKLRHDIFARVPDPAHRPATGGMGLGLYLTGMFVAKMGGDVSYRPRPGGGSVFTVTLPLAGVGSTP